MKVFESYRRVLAVPEFSGPFLLAQTLKLPTLAAPVALALHTAIGLGAGFAAAGLVTAVWTIGVAAGAPVQGRLLDRFGVRPVFLGQVVGQAVFWSLAAVLPVTLLTVCSAAGGFLFVPGGTVSRMVAGSAAPDDRDTAFALDAVMTNLCALVAPPAAVLIGSVAGTTALILVLGAVVVATTALFAATTAGKGTRPARPADATATNPRRTVPLIGAFLCVAASGAMLSGSDLGLVAVLTDVGQLPFAAAVLAVCVASSVAGGLWYGQRSRRVSPALLVATLGALMVPIGLVADWRWMAAAFLPAAACVAPTMSAAARVVNTLVAPHRRATVMSIFGAAMMVGSAIGSSVAGTFVQRHGGTVTFGVLGAIGVLSGLVAARLLRVRATADDPSPSARDIAAP